MPTAVTALIAQLVLATVGSYVAGRLLGIRVSVGAGLSRCCSG